MRTSLVVAVLVASCAQPVTAPVEARPSQSAQVQRGALSNEALGAFRAWLQRWSSTPVAERAGLEVEGEQLAAARRGPFHALLTTEPETALELSVSPLERLSLPERVAQHVERWRDGIGALHVIAGTAIDQAPVETERFVSFDDAPGEFLRAGVFGQRARESSRGQLRLHGVVLDGAIAVTDSRLRRLWPGEPRRDLPLDQPGACPVSKKKADPTLLYDGGDTLFGFCGTDHAVQYDATLAAAELDAALAVGAPPSATWTEGEKKVLLIRVDFSDKAGDPVSQSAAEGLLNTTVKNFYTVTSYGKVTIVGTVTPTLRLPKTQAQYQTNQDYMGLMTDSLAVAKAAGFDSTQWNFAIVGFVATFSGGWAGRGWVGSSGVWLNGYFDLRVTGHELGHNFGLNHANYWAATGLTVIGPGSNVEYANPFDEMGSSGGANSHFNAWFKRLLDWIPSSEANVVTTSGTYRIGALEQAITSGSHALKVKRDAQHDYWVEFRPGFGNSYLSNGASINWGYPYNTGSHLLDMTPGDNDRGNSALLIGRTFSDPLAGIHFTPVGKAGTTPDALDVVVNLGTFPGNRPPIVSVSASSTTPALNQVVTFNATASDPDGDPLAYSWSFDDGGFGPNASTATHSWNTARTAQVRLVVSDMKGQTASASLLITIGTPTTFTLSGQILMGGQPVAGVRVSDGTRVAFSSSDGRYALTTVPAGSVTLSAAMTDYTFAAGFTQPLTVAASMTGLDFTASAVTGYQVQGRVTWGSTGVAGVVVSDGSRTATTNSNGDYTLSGVPSGRYTLSATKAGWVFSTSASNIPLEVFGGNVTGINFFASGAGLSGNLPSAGVTTAPVITDGVRSVTATLSGAYWYWSMSGVPNGSWNVIATSPGVTLVPTFTNPVITTGTYVSGLNFTLAATLGTTVTGQVTTGGTPLPGVTISDGTRTSKTDELGRYVLIAVPAGSYTLTPTGGAYTFVPATRAVTVATTPLTGQDFTTTVVNHPPTIVTAAAASPNPVTTGTTTQLTVLGADDSGEAGLTYTWSTPSSWPVNFSANGTNAAKSTTVTFTGTGTYVFECLISDAGGLSVRSQVSVVVQGVSTSLSVSPSTANLLTGATRTFSANLLDQFGRSMYAGTPTWVLSGGGTFTVAGTNATVAAGMTPGGPFTLSATTGGRTASATFTVATSATPVITTAASATPQPVLAKTTAVSVRATDDEGEPGLTYTWNSLSGPAAVTFTPNASNAAKDSVATFTHAGDYVLQVTVADVHANLAVSSVTVHVNATPTTVDVQPAVSALQVGQTLQLSATITDQFDSPLSPQPTFAWTMATGGTVDSTGLVTAGSVVGGPFSVTATASTVSGSAQVTIGAAPDTQPPTVAVTSPSSGARLTGLVTLEASATDNVGVTHVEFFVDGVSVGQVTSAPWQAQVDLSSATDGAHTLTAKAVDAAGNSATSDGVAVTVGNGPVDQAAPGVSVVRPTTGQSSGLEVTVEVTATDDVGVAKVDLEVDGALVKTLTSAPWTVMLEVSAGPHSIVAIAWDASGKFTRSAAVSWTASTEVVTPAGPEPTTPLGAVVGGCGCTATDGAVWPFALVWLASRRRRGATGA